MDPFTKASELRIQTEFIDAHGQRQVTDLGALNVAIDALSLNAPHPLIDGAVVIRLGCQTRTQLKQAATFPLRWKIVSSDRIVAEGDAFEGAGYPADRVIDWPVDLPQGSYRLHLVDAAGLRDDAALIIAPGTAFSGDFDRCWLLAVQLYGLRSARNWGIGDFGDLGRLIDVAAQLGADGIGLNPLHALFDDRPADCSPYSPNSRLFLNALYIDVEKVPGFEPDQHSSEALARVRQVEVLDYVEVAGLKWRALRSAFHRFKTQSHSEHQQEFAEFRSERGALLSRFACFEAL